MTDATGSISDADLTAYLDGEAWPELVARIEAGLAKDAALAARLSALDVPLDQLQAMTPEALGAPAIPAKFTTQASPMRLAVATTRLGKVLPLGAALAAGLVIGAMFGPALLVPKPGTEAAMAPGWIAAVASYQALYGPETVAINGQPPEVTQSVLARFNTAFGIDLSPATRIDGLALKRAQPLSFNGRPLLQMVFATEDGTPVALCALAVTKPDRAPVSETAGGLAATHWVQDGVGFIVIGGDQTDVTDAMAARVIATL